MLLFATHALSLLHALRCQTSPDFSYLKYGNADKHMELDFSGDGGLLHYISSILLFWETDAGSCLAVDMIPSRSESWDRKGSLSLLWPLFQSLCLGQFIETISCTVQGRPPMTETGMTIFEHSLAFAEAEAMISNRLGLSLFGPPKNGVAEPTNISGSEPTITKLFTKSEILEKMNTPAEVLLMALISSLNNLSSQVLGLFNMQSRLRLVNTGIWGLCFMATFLWGVFSTRPESGPEAIILRFPTVCIVGSIPHMLVLIGILLCAAIYILALLLCFLSPPSDGPQPQSIADRFRVARENMQANVQLSSIRLDMQEDFYTAILKIGFSALTIASEAVYLNEGQRVTVAHLTWLEEERMKDFVVFKQLNDPSRRLDVEWEEVRTGDHHGPRSSRPWRSGYNRQINPKTAKSGIHDPMIRADGVGHMQRFGRYAMAATFLRGILRLYFRWLRLITSRMLDKAGISRRPQWLRFPKQSDEAKIDQVNEEQIPQPEFLPFWLEGEDGRSKAPKNDNFDVDAEFRKRIRKAKEDWSEVDEEDEDRAVDSQTYDWWKKRGQFGVMDGSGSYQASLRDDDSTSLISISTDASSVDHNDFDDDSGARTPTQRSPNPSNRSLSPTPEPPAYYGQVPSENLPGRELNPDCLIEPHPLDPYYLASLLDPKTSEKRAEARMLTHHMNSPKITTRSRYRHAQAFASVKLLTSTRYRPANSTIPASGPLSPDDEAQLLVQLILNRRSKPLVSDQAAAGWRDGAAGMGPSGPQCVICQSEPRTILAWPCRCLSLCEECRVTLAMNNFGNCVCCRQDVVGFSRLFVP
jgi:hypothetical protein